MMSRVGRRYKGKRQSSNEKITTLSLIFVISIMSPMAAAGVINAIPRWFYLIHPHIQWDW